MAAVREVIRNAVNKAVGHDVSADVVAPKTRMAVALNATSKHLYESTVPAAEKARRRAVNRRARRARAMHRRAAR